eukprot:scaffold88795_cov63-Phaeocystis_antarctica.AAC.1
MGPRTTNDQFSSQRVGPSRGATRHDDMYLTKLELRDFRPSPNLGGTTEALSPWRWRRRTRWRRA